MVMTITQLTTHYDAGEAHMLIEFLDELRDVLWSAYGEEIIAMHQRDAEQGIDKNDRHDHGQPAQWDDDQIEF